MQEGQQGKKKVKRECGGNVDVGCSKSVEFEPLYTTGDFVEALGFRWKVKPVCFVVGWHEFLEVTGAFADNNAQTRESERERERDSQAKNSDHKDRNHSHLQLSTFVFWG